MRRKIVLLVSLFLLGVGLVGAQDAAITLDTKTGTAYGLAWNSDGSILAIASGHELTLLSADLETLAQITESVVDAPFLNVAWSPNGDQLATVSGYGNPDIQVWDWDAQSGEISYNLTLHGDDAAIERAMRAEHQYGVTWGAAGLVSLANDRESVFQVWDVGAGQVTDFIHTDYRLPTYQFAWNADGERIIAAGEADEGFAIYQVNVESGEAEPILRLVEQPYSFSLVGDAAAAVAYEDGRIEVYDLKTGEVIQTLQGVDQPVAIDWQGDLLAVLGYEAGLQVWETER